MFTTRKMCTKDFFDMFKEISMKLSTCKVQHSKSSRKAGLKGDQSEKYHYKRKYLPHTITTCIASKWSKKWYSLLKSRRGNFAGSVVVSWQNRCRVRENHFRKLGEFKVDQFGPCFKYPFSTVTQRKYYLLNGRRNKKGFLSYSNVDFKLREKVITSLSF